MKRPLNEIVAVTGGGRDERGRLVLAVLARDGSGGVLAVTEQAAAQIPQCLSFAVLADKGTRRA